MPSNHYRKRKPFELGHERLWQDFFWEEKRISLAVPFLIFFIDRPSGNNQVDMRVVTQHAFLGMKNGMGTFLALELWIPTGKALNRFPSCFKQQVIADSLLSPEQGSWFSWNREGDHEIGYRH